MASSTMLGALVGMAPEAARDRKAAGYVRLDYDAEVYGRDAPREGPRVAFDENGDLVPPGDGGFLAGGMRRGRALQ